MRREGLAMLAKHVDMECPVEVISNCSGSLVCLVNGVDDLFEKGSACRELDGC